MGKGGRKGRGGRAGGANKQAAASKDNGAPKPIPVFEWEPVDPAPLPADLQTAVDSWAARLAATVGEEFQPHIQHHLTGTVQQLPALNDPTQIQGLQAFYLQHPNVAGSAENWGRVVGNRIAATGFKVCSAKGRRLWGGDDGVYRASPALQNYLPRGCVMVEQAGNPIPALAVFANRKFYGRSSGDDDDSDLTSQAIQRGNYSRFFVSTKANGESCHVALCPFDDSLWIIGSKNKKIAVASLGDVAGYKSEQGYLFAAEMAEAFFGYLEAMGREKVSQLKALLKLTRWTLNFEFESTQHHHIVRLLKTQLVLIGCTGIHVRDGKAAHPILGSAVARYFGFAAVLDDLRLREKAELAEVCQAVAREWDSEGAVLVLLDESNNVVDFVKVKSWWYILLRCIREKVRGLMKGPEALPAVCLGIIKRVRTLANSMKIADEFARVFQTLGVEFAEWIAKDTRRIDTCIDMYPVLWHEFLTCRQLPLDASLLTMVGDDASAADERFAQYERKALPLLVLTQGIPGIGKSYLAKRLAERLNAEGIACKDIAQDDFVAQAGQKGSGKACQAWIRKHLVARTYQVIILARNNGDPSQYRSYVDLDGEGLCRSVFICPKELATRMDEAVLLSVASVLSRQSRGDEGHPTDSMESCALASLPLKFYGNLRVHHSAFLVPVMTPAAVAIPDRSGFQQLLQRFKAKGFRAPDVTSKELEVMGLKDAGLGQLAKFTGFRRNIDESVTDCFQFLNHILRKSTPTPGSYYAVQLNTESSTALVEFANGFFPTGEVPSSWNVSCNHVTLMHSNSYFESTRTVARWEAMDQLLGQPITIRPVAFLLNERLSALQVTCVVADKQDVSIDKYVISGLPHVTIATAPGVGAHESAGELKKDQSKLTATETPVLAGTVALL